MDSRKTRFGFCLPRNRFSRYEQPNHPTVPIFGPVLSFQYNVVPIQHYMRPAVVGYSLSPTIVPMCSSIVNFPLIIRPHLGFQAPHESNTVHSLSSPYLNNHVQHRHSRNPNSASTTAEVPKKSVPLPERNTGNQTSGKRIDQYGLHSLILNLSESNQTKMTPDNICAEVVNEMNNLKLTYPNRPMHQYFNGPFGTSTFANDLDQTYPDAGRLANNDKVKMATEQQDTFTKQFNIQLDKYSTDLLFFIFYNFAQDKLQVDAALQLCNIGWRYHLEWKVWLSRNPNYVYTPVSGKNLNYLIERGIYNWFDVKTWKIQQAEMTCDFSKLDYSFAFINQTND